MPRPILFCFVEMHMWLLFVSIYRLSRFYWVDVSAGKSRHKLGIIIIASKNPEIWRGHQERCHAIRDAAKVEKLCQVGLHTILAYRIIIDNIIELWHLLKNKEKKLFVLKTKKYLFHNFNYHLNSAQLVQAKNISKYK